MKKTLTLIVALVCTLANAASTNWTISGRASNPLYEKDGTTIAANTTIYLILADAASLASITGLDSLSAFETALENITIGKNTAGADGKKPAQSTILVSSPLIDAGKDYAMGALYYSTDAQGGYWKIAPTTGTAFDPSVSGSTGSTSTTFSTLQSASWTTGYTAVPEPSTTVLALAGLALLLKRRRA